MTVANWVQLISLIVALVIGTRLLGPYLAAVFGGGEAPGDRFFGPIERFVYRLSGVNPEARAAVERLRPEPAGLQRHLGARPVPAATGPGVAAVEPDGRGERSASPLVEHRDQLHHQHELAELRRRVDHEPSHADGWTHRAELRIGRGGTRRRRRPHPRTDAPAPQHRRQLLGRPHPSDAPRPHAARDRVRGRDVQSGRRAELPRLHHRDDCRRRESGDPWWPHRQSGVHQGARHQRRRALQRQLVPSVREPERVHQLAPDVHDPAHPVRPHVRVRSIGRRPEAGLGDIRRHVLPVDRGGRTGHVVGDRRQSEARPQVGVDATSHRRPIGRQRRRQGNPLRSDRDRACSRRSTTGTSTGAINSNTTAIRPAVERSRWSTSCSARSARAAWDQACTGC